MADHEESKASSKSNEPQWFGEGVVKGNFRFVFLRNDKKVEETLFSKLRDRLSHLSPFKDSFIEISLNDSVRSTDSDRVFEKFHEQQYILFSNCYKTICNIRKHYGSNTVSYAPTYYFLVTENPELKASSVTDMSYDISSPVDFDRLELHVKMCVFPVKPQILDISLRESVTHR